MSEEQIVRHIHENKENRPDSITIGTPGKGGEVKVYFNASAPEAEIRALIDAAVRARGYADMIGGPAAKPPQEGKS